MLAFAAFMVSEKVSALAWALPRTTESDRAGAAAKAKLAVATATRSATTATLPVGRARAPRGDRPSPRNLSVNTVRRQYQPGASDACRSRTPTVRDRLDGA
jgi:hypothetical protein